MYRFATKYHEKSRQEEAMEDPKEKLLKEIEALRKTLQDAEKRLPAHSVRPHQLMEIEELEEQIAEKRRELEAL